MSRSRGLGYVSLRRGFSISRVGALQFRTRPRKAQIDGRINFGLGDIGAALSRSLARLSPFFSRRSSLAGFTPAGGNVRTGSATISPTGEVSLSCLHGKRARLLFLSHGRSRGMCESETGRRGEREKFIGPRKNANFQRFTRELTRR